MATVCWLFFNPVVAPETIATFAGHTHEVEYIGDCPEGGYVVPCDACLVNNGVVVLTYDSEVAPPAQAGVIVTPV